MTLSSDVMFSRARSTERVPYSAPWLVIAGIMSIIKHVTVFVQFMLSYRTQDIRCSIPSASAAAAKTTSARLQVQPVAETSPLYRVDMVVLGE